MRTRERIRLQALTVNPLAPQSHRFGSAQLRARLEHALPDLPVFDVLDPAYAAQAASHTPA